MIAGSMMNRPDMPSLRRLAAPFASLAAFCAAILLATPAQSADKSKAAPAAKAAAPAKDTTPILTQAQLRDCMAQKDRLTRDTDAAVKSKTDIDAMKAEIDSTGNALSTEATTLDKTNADAVAAYNGKIEARNGLIDGWKARVAGYNQDAESVLSTKDAYAKACENRRYDDRDLNDLQRKK